MSALHHPHGTLTDDSDPILIWGAGAVGGTIGAHLARAGHPVVLVDVVADHVAAIHERGLTIEGPITPPGSQARSSR